MPSWNCFELPKDERSRENSETHHAKPGMGKRKPSLLLNERVVWIDADGEAEGGTVKWVGKLDPRHSQCYAGIEFDNPIGTGTGRHMGKNLFHAKVNHASLVPVIGLIRERDFKPSPDRHMDLSEFSIIHQEELPRLSKASSESYDSEHEAVLVDLQSSKPSTGAPKPGRKKLFSLHPASKEVAKVVEEARKDPAGSELEDPDHISRNADFGTECSKDLSCSREAVDKQEGSSSGSQTTIVSVDSCEFTPDTCVEVKLSGQEEPWFGVVKWVGLLPVTKNSGGVKMLMVGIELEERLPLDWGLPADGSYKGTQYFSCVNGRGIFVPPSELRVDHRFNTTVMSLHEFGTIDSGIVEKHTRPQSSLADIGIVCGKHRGIQGHRNSCYLDASLYAMFAHTDAFDSLFLRPRRSDDIPDYDALTTLLSTEIVYPLRLQNYVRADHVVRFRQLLNRLLPEIEGLTSEEKDPEELLGGLLGRLLKVEPYLELKSMERIECAHLCPLVLDLDAQSPVRSRSSLSLKSANGDVLQSVQGLLERSFFTSGVKLAKIPPCLIVQVPRYGRKKIFSHIFPNDQLDLTHVMLSAPRPCHLCDKEATVECGECFLTGAESLNQITFCASCFAKFHNVLPNGTGDHTPNMLTPTSSLVPAAHKQGLPIPRIQLELVSVLCIETSHYVAYSRVGQEHSAEGYGWVLFDSMADRKGAEDGYNIPEVTECPGLRHYLSPEGFQELEAAVITGETESALPRYVKRLLNDCYFCFYVWPQGKYYS